MCGIFGVVVGEPKQFGPELLRQWSDSLFELSETRGKEAAGIAFLKGDKLKVYRQAIRGTKFIKREKYSTLFRKALNSSPLAFIGHSRLATNGFQTRNLNNQPVSSNGGAIVHNGIIVNDSNLWKKVLKKKPKFEVDTEVILELLEGYFERGFSIESSVIKAYQKLQGSASIAFFSDKAPYLTLATNTGSLYFVQSQKLKVFVFASEAYILGNFTQKFLNAEAKVKHLWAGEGLKVNLESLKIAHFKLSGNSSKTLHKVTKKLFSVVGVKEREVVEPDTLTIYSVRNSLKKLKKHDFVYKKIYKLARCTKCILPATTPFIKFDKNGVCNYCRNNRRIRTKGREALESLVAPYRSKNGEPDCILAFSGGRDSSYGLQFLKKELKMNPVAYTYDWGMVTDVARRNEARMVGKLGIEHIIVSADITMKRNHIRKHILAWIKKPDLGMVPLFMEGDKQCEYYADELAKKMGINLIFYTRGNEFENEEFKWGHCGITNANPGGVIHDLSFSGKVKILSYYAWQYVTNPSYINSSLPDTLFAYFSTYVQKHDYVYLWHYIPWNEQEIISTLKQEYIWETESETRTTWRTDDGTSAFYNYIYYTVQGFTENDSFRSNQIREGLLSRGEALKLVNEENKPRRQALKWYFDRIGLDGDKVLSVVDNMPKLY